MACKVSYKQIDDGITLSFCGDFDSGNCFNSNLVEVIGENKVVLFDFDLLNSVTYDFVHFLRCFTKEICQDKLLVFDKIRPCLIEKLNSFNDEFHRNLEMKSFYVPLLSKKGKTLFKLYKIDDIFNPSSISFDIDEVVYDGEQYEPQINFISYLSFHKISDLVRYSHLTMLLYPVVVLDENLRIIFANRQAADLIGVSHKRCIEKNISFVKNMSIEGLDFSKTGIYFESKYVNKKGNSGFIQYILQKDLSVPGRSRTIFFANITSLEIHLRDQYREEKEQKEKTTNELQKVEKLADKFSKLASIDELTGLANYRTFLKDLNKYMDISRRMENPLSLVIFDIDHFKKLNDTYGHEQGNVALKKLSKVLKDLCRDSDSLARYGGEEFTCILNNASFSGMMIFMERARIAIEEMEVENLQDKAKPLKITASFGGVSMFVHKLPRNFNKTQFIERVDENLYKAKNSGRNCIVGSKWDE